MTYRPFLAFLTLGSLYACSSDISQLGTGVDSGGKGGNTSMGASAGDTDLGMGADSGKPVGAGGSVSAGGKGGGGGRGGKATTGGTSMGATGGTGMGATGGTGMGAIGGTGMGATGGTGMGATGGTGMGAIGGTGMGAFGGTGMGAIGGTGMGAFGGTGMGATGGTGMGATGGTDACQIDWIDTKQGEAAPAPEDCDQIGADLKAAHDAAIHGKALEVDPLVGTWIDGTGSAKIELMLAQDGTGMLRFGEASEFPAIDDPTQAYLTDVTPDDPHEVLGLAHEKIQPGFGYSVIADSGRGSEMSFHIQVLEAFERWCEQQPPISSPLGRSCYSCMEDVGTFTFFTSNFGMGCGAEQGCFASYLEADESKRVDCGRFALCDVPYNSACLCNADGCFANMALNDQLTVYPFTATVDPLDTTVVRLASLSEFQKTTYYLVKQ